MTNGLNGNGMISTAVVYFGFLVVSSLIYGTMDYFQRDAEASEGTR